jgi:hypothetical protein
MEHFGWLRDIAASLDFPLVDAFDGLVETETLKEAEFALMWLDKTHEGVYAGHRLLVFVLQLLPAQGLSLEVTSVISADINPCSNQDENDQNEYNTRSHP